MVKLLNLNGAVFNLLVSVLFLVNFCDNDIHQNSMEFKSVQLFIGLMDV